MRVGWRAMPWLALALLVGCSGVRTYSSALPENMRVHTRVESASAMMRTVAEFDIHRVNAHCQTEYLGRVYLDKPEVRVGIPVSQPLYFDFIFASKGVLSPNISGTRYGTVFTPRPGYEYVAQVRYLSGVYEVVIREARPGVAGGRVIERRPLSACGKG